MPNIPVIRITVTGPPGSGKSAVIQSIMESLQRLGLEVIGYGGVDGNNPPTLRSGAVLLDCFETIVRKGLIIEIHEAGGRRSTD